MLFSRLTKDVCCICGSREALTGEHKIKKTNLKRYPVMEPRFQKVGDGSSRPIQGLNSKYLKFNDSICADCNNRRTQKADRSYDRFRNEESEELQKNLNQKSQKDGFSGPTEFIFGHRKELARYFGKHLGCAIEYQKFAVPRRLSKFVSGRSEVSCVSLDVRIAPFAWRSDEGLIGPLNALGGALITTRDRITRLPVSYVHAFMTDGLQFVVSMRLSYLASLEIRLAYLKDFGPLHRDQTTKTQSTKVFHMMTPNEATARNQAKRRAATSRPHGWSHLQTLRLAKTLKCPET